LDFPVDQLPLDGLIATKEVTVIKIQPDQFHDLFDFCRRTEWDGEWSP
jgi:hypothetical protein